MKSFQEISITEPNEPNEPTGMIFDVQRNSFVDGPGVRTAVFFKGCNLRCAWCHNPESQSQNAELLFDRSKCTSCGRCAEAFGSDPAFECPSHAKKRCGKRVTVDEVLAECVKDQRFFDTSGGGVTFSGGECMLQIDFLEALLKRCKQKGLNTAIDTAGNLPYDRFERILGYTDLFLYDVKCADPDLHKRYTGADNRLILENLRRLLASGAHVWVRIPIIPTVNDTVEEMQRIRSIFTAGPTPEKIELLPYHSMGEGKYGALGRTAHRFDSPSRETMERLRQVFLPR